ncbi:MAG: leucyl aminopeptidase [Nitrospirota bacterium]
MKINIQTKIKSSKGLLVAPVFKETIKKLPSIYPKVVKEFIREAHKNKDLKTSAGSTISTYNLHKGLPEKILVISLGSAKKLSLRTAKETGGKIGKYAKVSKASDISILLPKEATAQTQHLVEGLLMSQYEEETLKSKKKKDDSYELKNLEIVVESKSKTLDQDLEKAMLISKGAEYVKDLVNKPSNMVDVIYLVNEAKRIAKANKYKLKVITQKELKKLKWGALLAVNQGSTKEASCIAIQYDGAKNKKEKPVIIVGKGLIFDTGGYNLKPTHYIETMQQDMAGGAVVLGVFEALKKMKIKRNVIGIIPIAENLISADAYRPSDVITSYSGKTIEITNTDAEGRLVLADGITYGTKFKPEAIITIATLTGAVAVATGDRYSGLIGNDRKLRSALKKAGRQTDDLGWELPIHRDFRKKMKSKVADLRNYDIGSGKYAGASKAAAFLENFVEKNKWCHIDIGGTAFTEDPKAYQTKGATAQGLEMLLKFLENA